METSYKVEDTLMHLHITRKHHCVLIQYSDSQKGKLNHARSFITWGEVTLPVVEELLTKKGRISGDKPLTAEYLSKNSAFKTIPEFAKALFDGKATMKDVKGLKPMFRLSPPRKGYKHSIKRPFPKGEVGKRGPKINDLIVRMT